MKNHKIVIIGAGFGGLYAARVFADKNVDVTVIEKRNFHLFQPLLYQVATGGLSPGDIASPVRAVFENKNNIGAVCAEMDDLNISEKCVKAGNKKIRYDSLIIATGVSHHYFGNDHWGKVAPGLKTIEDALRIRKRIMKSFEQAELENDQVKIINLQRFVIVGAGPTGVELAGALGELANQTLLHNFRYIDPSDTEIYLIEGADRILPGFSEHLSKKAEKSLNRLGVKVLTKAMVNDVQSEYVQIEKDNKVKKIYTNNIFWAAGVKAPDLSKLIADRTGAKLDRAGRIIVDPFLNIPGYKDIFVIGDLASFKTKDGVLPGVAQVAMQQGRFVAELILNGSKKKTNQGFKYFDKGNMAVIGRKAAIVQIRKFAMYGWPAWLVWIFIHITYLIGYDNKMKVLLQWAWNFFTRKRGARLITDI